MLAHISTTHHVDSVFWTGDNSSHNTWNNTEDEVNNYTTLITNEIKAAFDKRIPVYPSLGNHDTWPVNVEDFSAPGIIAPINNIADSWGEWIGEEAAAEFAQWGYCSVPFKLTDGRVLENSKVLVLNTQVANNMNWYLAGEKNDPANHIKWIETQLKEIEAAGGIAYMVGRIQPHNYTHQFGARYQALMERYQHIVRFSLTGHTHDQYFSVMRASSDFNKFIQLG